MPRNKLSKFDKELRELISNNLKKYAGHLTQSQLSDMTGIPSSTLSGYFAMRSTPNAGSVQKIADALHIQKSEIDPRFSPEFLKTGKLHPNTSGLTIKEEREIESDLEDMMNSISSAAYNGQEDIEDMEAFKATIKAAMIQAKKIAKKKYTPKKYRKD
jgi:transcriptional regulator with XRE-family HTH domain